MLAQDVTIANGDGPSLSGLWQGSAAARACLVLAHGAGAGMTHPSMTALAEGLAIRDIATLRYQFPYMELGSRRDREALDLQPGLRLAAREAAVRPLRDDPLKPMLIGQAIDVTVVEGFIADAAWKSDVVTFRLSGLKIFVVVAVIHTTSVDKVCRP